MAARRNAEQIRKDRRQISKRWFPAHRYKFNAGPVPRDPVQRVALRLARADGRESRMAVELFRLLSMSNPGDLERAIPRMTGEDIAHTRSRLHDLAAVLAYDQRLVEDLLETLADAERRRLRVLDGGRA